MGGVPPSAKKLLIPLPPGKIFLEKKPLNKFLLSSYQKSTFPAPVPPPTTQ